MTAPLFSDLPAELFEGVLPAALASAAADQAPNATWLSQVWRVDSGHVALSCQFFRKTRSNLGQNPVALLLLTHPRTVEQWRLLVRYSRSETTGTLFDTMARRIATVSAAENESVFALRSADIFEVLEVEKLVIEPDLSEPGVADRGAVMARKPAGISALLRLSESIAASKQLSGLLESGLSVLGSHFGYDSVSLYLLERSEGILYALASRGFPQSGVGARIPLGVGIIGSCAQHRLPIRIADLARERRYDRAVVEQAARAKGGEREIALPALEQAASALAVPLVLRGSLFGVLAAESREILAFDEQDEQLLATAGQLLAQGVALHEEDDSEPEAPPLPVSLPTTRGVLRLRYYEADDSVFVDDEYLIKGIPGRILWLIVSLRETEHRSTFQNRELRLHPLLKLPTFKDNLEARLLMLQRRLEEKSIGLRLRREDRGRLHVECNLQISIEVTPAG
jgi:adenylate cyclase